MDNSVARGLSGTMQSDDGGVYVRAADDGGELYGDFEVVHGITEDAGMRRIVRERQMLGACVLTYVWSHYRCR